MPGDLEERRPRPRGAPFIGLREAGDGAPKSSDAYPDGAVDPSRRAERRGSEELRCSVP
jgi:hypothetical protein